MLLGISFFLTFLTIQVSCHQKPSVAFILDDTWSSVNKFNEVKLYAKNILDMILAEIWIEDILVLTFNRSEITRTDMTQDKRLFRKALDLIDFNTFDNKDCAEIVLSGIVKGLKDSQNCSYLYVFTEASAKDYHRFEEVKTLCLEKKIKVFFILTGYCHGTSLQVNTVYNDIAVACGGEVIRIKSYQLDKIFQFLRESVKVAQNVVKSTEIPPSANGTEIKIKKYLSIDYMLVSARGKDVELTVVDEKGNRIGNTVAWTRHLKVLKLERLRNGEDITVKARCDNGAGNSGNGHVTVYGHNPVQRVEEDTKHKERYYGYSYFR